MIQDQNIAGAIPRILQRSERHTEVQKFTDTFVDSGILPLLTNNNNQIIYGRRGTGKTHIFNMLANHLRTDSANVVANIDMRTLGSTAQFSDPSIPIHRQCMALFRDLLAEVNNSLLEHLTKPDKGNVDLALEALDKLSQVLIKPVEVAGKQELQHREAKESSQNNGGKIGASTSFVEASLSTHSRENQTVEDVRSETLILEDKIIFPSIIYPLRDVLTKSQIILYILLDEWSSIPISIQPFLAEFIKRSLLPIPQIVIKIASLEYRSEFCIRKEKNELLGFELGSDIAANLDIDDFYVYDRNPEKITNIFGEILFKHLSSELPAEYLEKEYLIRNGGDLSFRMFSSREVFQELVRASEGVVRDLISIFTLAFAAARQQGREKVDKYAVTDAARKWFEQDKSQALDQLLQEILRRIVDEVIGKRRARSFLVRRELEKNTFIQKLFDFRVIHVMHRGYADKSNPGVRYNIYTLDYGTYVDLINTSKCPDLGMEIKNAETADRIVPFDDKRTIRRIILEEGILREV